MAPLALALLAACGERRGPELRVAERLLAVDGPHFASGLVRNCELDGEIRPSLGCTTRVVESLEAIEFGTPTWRPRIAVPESARGRPAAVDARVREPATAVSHLIPLQLVAEPLGEELEIEFALPEAAVGGVFDAEVRLRPAPPPEQVFTSEEIALPGDATLAFGIGLDPVGRWIPSSGVEFTVVARAPDGGAVELFREVLDPKDRRRGWRDRRVSLAPVSGRKVRLELRTRTIAARDEPGAGIGFPLWGTANLLVPAGDSARWNVVLISFDTLRADALGVYGSPLPTSPHFDALAAEGTLFENAFTTWPSTTVSHMSMLTGLFPSAFVERTEMQRPLPRSRSMLAELLGHAGWATAAVTEDAFVVAGMGFQRGFDSYRENKGPGTHRSFGDVRETFGQGLDWIRHHRDEAFFVFLHTYQVHSPYQPPPEFDVFTVAPGSAPATMEQMRRLQVRGLYAGEVLYADTALGELVAGLRDLGVLDSTILVLTADHGEAFGEHDLNGHANSLYDEVLHVPLIVRAPGLVPAGARPDTTASLVDVVPTVLDLLGLPARDDVGGRSLVPVLRDPTGPAGRDRAVFAELHRGDQHLMAVRTADRKWILDVADGSTSAAYDLRADPGELAPVRSADALAPGEAILRDYVAASAASRARAESAPAEPLWTPDEEIQEKLRVLGYVE